MIFAATKTKQTILKLKNFFFLKNFNRNFEQIRTILMIRF